MTVDPEVIEAGNRAVAAGLADSLSGWVNNALSEKAEHETLLENGRKAIAAYEAEFGKITEEEMAEQRRIDHENAIVVRDGKSYYPGDPLRDQMRSQPRPR